MMENKKASLLGKLLTPKGLTGVRPSTVLEFENEEDRREAAENFRAYLLILREWDKEKLRIRDDLTIEARNLN